MKFTSTTFESLEPGDEFKFTPSMEADKHIKTEKSVSIQNSGVYNTISIDGQNKYLNVNPDKNVYKIS